MLRSLLGYDQHLDEAASRRGGRFTPRRATMMPMLQGKPPLLAVIICISQLLARHHVDASWDTSTCSRISQYRKTITGNSNNFDALRGGAQGTFMRRRRQASRRRGSSQRSSAPDTFSSWPSFLSSLDVPTLFPNQNETKYDRYAACLAATEGIRRSRDVMTSPNPSVTRQGDSAVSERADVAGEVSTDRNDSLLAHLGRQLCSLGLGGGKQHSAMTSTPPTKPDAIDEETYRRVSVSYVLQSARVVRALGLTIPQFNQLGREVGSNTSLKERVMEQAYLYRLAATLCMDKVHVHDDPLSQKLLRAHRRRRIQMFARSMTDIEELRKEQQEKLRKALNLDRLPEGVSICDPLIQPLLSPKVRAVCAAFPIQAEEIIDKYGLNSEEFNQMLDESKNNPLFKFQVLRYVRKGRKEEGTDAIANSK